MNVIGRLFSGALVRPARILLGLSLLMVTTGPVQPGSVLAATLATNRQPQGAVPAPGAPVLENAGFECTGGYHDQAGIRGMVSDGWTGSVLDGSRPFMNSTQMWATMGSCDPNDMGWEKLEGADSFIVMGDWGAVGQDFTSPPFDVAIHQQTAVTPGTAYSASGWLTSLCGGSASPNDCPAGYYISKQIGIDPTGGTNPLAPSVQWVEDRRPHTTAKWVDVRLAATAQAVTMTVFVRVRSPFTWHGNHAFADAIKLVRAPASSFSGLRSDSDLPGFHVAWTGNLGPDIPAIPAGNYHLLYDVQYRRGAGGVWQDWIVGQPAGSADLPLSGSDVEQEFWFRVRSRAEQPEGQPGASPNHRFPGVWTETGCPLTLGTSSTCTPRSYLPIAATP